MQAKKQPTPKCYSYIRFSTPDQISGDSLTRQLKLSQEYAEKNGLVLDEKLNFKDLGLSAYSGDHKTRGALGKFLELVEKSKIPKGSKLIVESLDRLSREQVLSAFNQFVQIINKGITIVTLTDYMEYSADSINANFSQLMFSITIMARAHEESAMKAKRLSSAWKTKRENIKKKKLTSMAPAWLRLNKKNQEFEAIPDRSKLIKRIFRLYLDGNGIEKIARKLNSKVTPAWRSKNGWHPSYIQKILHNRSVLGEFQPHKLKNKKRVPVGNPIDDYYPKIISESQFYKVQERMKSNAGKGGKSGKIKNLFGYVAKCGYCGSSMQYVNKGKGDEYLVCNNTRRGRGCVKTSFRYKEFEKAFLEFCTELNLQDVLPDKDGAQDAELVLAKKAVEDLNGKIKDIDRKISNLDSALGIADSKAAIEHIAKNYDRALKEKETLTRKLEKAQSNLNRLLSSEQTAEAQIKSIKELLKLLKKKKGSELVNLRMRLRSEIRQLVNRIDVFPDGLRNYVLSLKDLPDIRYEQIDDFGLSDLENLGFDPDLFPSKKAYEAACNEAKQKFAEYLESNNGKEHRRFGIFFKAGGFKEIIHEDRTYSVNISGDDGFGVLEEILNKIPDGDVKA